MEFASAARADVSPAAMECRDGKAGVQGAEALRDWTRRAWVRGTASAWVRAMMTVVLCILAFSGVGLLVGLITAARAPLGYEDESGFHFGVETPRGREVHLVGVE
jgi:hypothetical protein